MNSAVPRLVDGPGGPYPIFRGKPLYHPEAARAGAENTARRFTPPEDCIILVASPLLGYGLDILLQRLPSSSRVLCVEREQGLMRLSLDTIPPEILGDKRVHFLRTDNPEAAAEEAERIFGFENLRRVSSLKLNRGAALHSLFYREVEGALLRRIQNYWRNQITKAHLARLWVGNLFTNLSLLPQSLPLNLLRLEKPTLIIGAGESLENHIPFLHRKRESLSIVAVDSALPILLSQGLRPDLVVIAEAQFANLANFLGPQDWTIPVAADILSYPPILRRFTGKRYLFTSRFDELHWFKRPEIQDFLPPLLPPMGSVGVMALKIAATASPSDLPLFLAGLDLSYFPGKPHARGSSSHRSYLCQIRRLSPPRQYAAWYRRPKSLALFKNGQQRLSDAVLASYRDGIQLIASQREGVYDLPGPGLDLGLTQLNHAEAEAYIDSYKISRHPAPLPFPAGRTAWDSKETQIFIDGILKEMEALADRIRLGDFTESPLEGQTSPLEALDILTADISSRPQAEQLPSLLLPRLGHYLTKLQRAGKCL